MACKQADPLQSAIQSITLPSNRKVHGICGVAAPAQAGGITKAADTAFDSPAYAWVL